MLHHTGLVLSVDLRWFSLKTQLFGIPMFRPEKHWFIVYSCQAKCRFMFMSINIYCHDISALYPHYWISPHVSGRSWLSKAPVGHQTQDQRPLGGLESDLTVDSDRWSSDRVSMVFPEAPQLPSKPVIFMVFLMGLSFHKRGDLLTYSWYNWYFGP
jgi:hypothetical protein